MKNKLKKKMKEQDNVKTSMNKKMCYAILFFIHILYTILFRLYLSCKSLNRKLTNSKITYLRGVIC